MDIKKSTFFRSGRISVSRLVLSINFIWHDKGGDNFPNLQYSSEKKLSQARKKFVEPMIKFCQAYEKSLPRWEAGLLIVRCQIKLNNGKQFSS